jgi:hypothetical protein
MHIQLNFDLNNKNFFVEYMNKGFLSRFYLIC